MTRPGRNLLFLVVLVLAGGLLSCQSESDFAPIPIDSSGTTLLAGTVTTATGPLANAIVTLEPLVGELPARVHAAAGGSEALTLPNAGSEPLSPLGEGARFDTPAIRATVTDALGRFEFAGVHTGGFQVEARGRDHLGATRRVTIGPVAALAETTLIDIRLTPTGDYYGTVTLETLSSHQGTLVYIDGTSHVAATRPSGAYVIEGVPVGTHTVRATHPGWLDRTAMGTIAAAGDSIPLATLVLPRDS
ncbi:MAG TPA: carboxypeptidase-like regulatory domain-containing protein, partial [Candidatus Eisenbacteria bacterium]